MLIVEDISGDAVLVTELRGRASYTNLVAEEMSGWLELMRPMT